MALRLLPRPGLGIAFCSIISMKASHIMQQEAAIAQLGERQTEDLEVPGSIPGLGSVFLHGRTIWLRRHRFSFFKATWGFGAVGSA